MKQLIHTLALLIALPIAQAQTITDFAPKNGKEGTEITITGSGFNIASLHWVQFGAGTWVSATITDATEITADVPENAAAGDISVSTDMSGTTVVATTASLSDDFRYVSIESFTYPSQPNPVELGETITFTGTGFATRGNTALYPSSTPLEAAVANFDISFIGCGAGLAQRENAFNVNATGTVAKVKVPTCARNGNMTVYVQTNFDEGTDYADVTFMGSDFNLMVNVPTPVITSFTPTEATVGTEITITGTGFGATVGENEVSFGSSGSTTPKTARKSAGVHTLIVRVPANAKDGEIKVRAFSKNALSGPTNLFTRLNHTVTTFSPTTFTSGEEVTITGTNFSTRRGDNQVCFEINSDMNCVAASSVNEDGTELTAIAPEVNNTQTGTLKVKIGPVTVDVGAFTLEAIPSLTITDFEPKEVNLGTVVTITGTGLYHSRFDHPYDEQTKPTAGFMC